MTKEELFELMTTVEFKEHLLEVFKHPRFGDLAGQAMVSARRMNLIKHGVTGVPILAQNFTGTKSERFIKRVIKKYGADWFRSKDVKSMIEDILETKLTSPMTGHVCLKMANDKLLERKIGSANVSWYRVVEVQESTLGRETLRDDSLDAVINRRRVAGEL